MKIINQGDDTEWAPCPDKRGTNFTLSFIALTYNCTIRNCACEVVIRIFITTEIQKVIFQCQLHGIAWCKSYINITIEKWFIYSIANSPKKLIVLVRQETKMIKQNASFTAQTTLCRLCSIFTLSQMFIIYKKIYLETLKTWSNRVNVPQRTSIQLYIHTEDLAKRRAFNHYHLFLVPSSVFGGKCH